MENKEIRTILNDDSEVRAVAGSRNIEGYGIVFNKESRDLGGFTEIILPEAVEGVLERSDVLALLNHDMSRGVLARSDNGKGTMKLSVDSRGVKYSFEAPNFDLGNELIEGVKRGDIKGSSFAFTTESDSWDYKRDPALRTIKKFSRIYDISPCYHEAYQDTTVALRNLETLKDTVVETVKEETKPVIVDPIIEPIVEVKAVEEPIIEQRNTNLKINKMQTLDELLDKKTHLIEENDKIYQSKSDENRTMSDKEEAQTASNNKLLKELNLQIETETSKRTSGVPVGGSYGPYIKFAREDNEPFSLMAAIRAKMEQREMPASARNMFVYGREAFKRAGLSTSGDIILPFEMRANELVAGTQYLGKDLVPEDKKAILAPLWNELIFTQAGATYLSNCVGDVSVPSMSDATIAWKGEIAAADSAAITTNEVLFSPKRLTAFIEVSKLFLIQTGAEAERMLMNILNGATARKLESTILGVAVGSATQPQGMGYKFTTGTDTKGAGVVPTYASLVALESSVDAANAAVGNLAYITNASGRGILKSIDKGVNNDTGDMLASETGIVNGYRLLVTNGASGIASTDSTSDLLVFGNWKDLCICQWGGYDITVDPYTAAKNGMVVITINAYFDAKGLRGSVATDVHGVATTAADDYAISFASTAIKAS